MSRAQKSKMNLHSPLRKFLFPWTEWDRHRLDMLPFALHVLQNSSAQNDCIAGRTNRGALAPWTIGGIAWFPLVVIIVPVNERANGIHLSPLKMLVHVEMFGDLLVDTRYRENVRSVVQQILKIHVHRSKYIDLPSIELSSKQY